MIVGTLWGFQVQHHQRHAGSAGLVAQLLRSHAGARQRVIGGKAAGIGDQDDDAPLDIAPVELIDRLADRGEAVLVERQAVDGGCLDVLDLAHEAVSVGAVSELGEDAVKVFQARLAALRV